jgi:hypothetical protein
MGQQGVPPSTAKKIYFAMQHTENVFSKPDPSFVGANVDYNKV